jgi:hypothetical protein
MIPISHLDKVRSILVALGIVLLIYTTLLCHNYHGWESAIGVVDSVDKEAIRFTYTRGNGIRWGHTMRPTFISRYKPGDTAQILYAPDRKNDILARDAWLGTTLSGAIGLLMVIVGYFGFRKPANKHAVVVNG